MRNYAEEHKDELVLIDKDNLEKLQKCYLSMLKDIDSFFERNGIQYCISGGSVLGQLRHNGFIPWDDDIDLTIPREDYQKLIKMYESSDDPFFQKYDFRGPGCSKGAIVRVAKLYKKDSIMRTVISKDNAIEKIYIDLFVIDYVPDNNFKMYLRGLTTMFLIGIISCVETKLNGKNTAKLDCGVQWEIQRRIRLLLGTVFSIIPLKKWYDLLNKASMNTKSNKVSSRITFPTGRIFYFAEMMMADDYYPFQRTDFCGVKTWMPRRPEKYLENRYGDWKKIPPPEDRESHYVRELVIGNVDL